MDFRLSGTFLLLQILVWRSQDTAAQFVVTAPPDPTMVVVGNDVVLDCQLVPAKAPADMKLRWINMALTYSSPVHVYQDGSDDLALQASAYKGRTELFLDQISQGNISLKLKDVRVSDRGQYKCFVDSTGKQSEAKITLVVTVTGRQPWMEMESYAGSGIRLACKSEGWFPQPPVQWLDGNGKNVTVQPETTYQQDALGLHTIRSNIEVPSNSKNKYTCIMNNNLLKESQQAHILISDVFFPHASGWMVAFWIFFFLMFAAGCLALWYIRRLRHTISMYKFSTSVLEIEKLQNQIEEEKSKAQRECEILRKETAQAKEAGKSECVKLRQEFEIERNAFKTEKAKLQSEFAENQNIATAEYTKLQIEFEQWRPLVKSEWAKIQSYAAVVKLDPKTANASLTVSPDGVSVQGGGTLDVPDNPERFDSVPYVLGAGGFTAGAHYWEVSVADKAYWDVGVVDGSVQRKGMPTLCTEAGFWTLGRDGEPYGASEANRSAVTVTTRPKKIGVYLELEAGRVSFYNADTMFHLYTFNAKFSDKVYPFVWPGWDDTPITICPVKN